MKMSGQLRRAEQGPAVGCDCKGGPQWRITNARHPLRCPIPEGTLVPRSEAALYQLNHGSEL